MTTFTIMVIIGFLMIAAGVSLMATPLMTFLGTGYWIIILFFITGLFGLVQGIVEKRYNKEFYFSILSLVLGVIGLVVPGMADMSNAVLLYMAATWFIIQGVMDIVDAIADGKDGAETGEVVVGILLGALEIILGILSVAQPLGLAINLGVLIGLYYIESGMELIVTAEDECEGGNSLSTLFIVFGVMLVISGIVLFVTPLRTFFSLGYCIILLFFLNGVLGIVRAINENRFGKEFFFAILSLILGIIGFAVPDIAAMNNSILLYMAAAWFVIHGVLTIIGALESRKLGAGAAMIVIGIVLGAVEIVLGIYAAAHPLLLAISLGFLFAFSCIESGVNMIFTGSDISRAAASIRAQQYR